MMMLWELVKALVGGVIRGLLVGALFYVVGWSFVSAGIMPSGAEALGIIGWAVGANASMAFKVHQAFDRQAHPGVPWREQRSLFFFHLFAAGAAGVVMGLFFEAVVYAGQWYLGAVDPYYCMLAFGISFVAFWGSYFFTSGSGEPEEAQT